MKKLMIVAALAGMSVAVQAQDKEGRKTPEERAQLRTERLTKELELSPEQATQVQAINLKYADKMDELRKEREAERGAMRSDAQAMGDAHDTEMKAVLTADQYAKWTTRKEELKARHAEKRKGFHEKKGR